MSRIPPEQRQMLDGRYVRRGDYLVFNVSVVSVSDPPTDAELDAIFGTAANLPSGFAAVISSGLLYWDVRVVGTKWIYKQWDVAV